VGNVMFSALSSKQSSHRISIVGHFLVTSTPYAFFQPNALRNIPTHDFRKKKFLLPVLLLSHWTLDLDVVSGSHVQITHRRR